MPLAAFVLLLLAAPAAASSWEAPLPSTAPAVSTSTAAAPAPADGPFVREAARRLDVPAEDAVDLRKRGFGKTELLSFIAIAKKSPRPWKDLVRDRESGRRLRDMAREAGLDYNRLFRESSLLREEIEKSLGGTVVPR